MLTVPIEPRALVPPASATSSSKLKIVLDPGHGGIDAGTSGPGGTLEKTVTLAFAASPALRVLAESAGVS